MLRSETRPNGDQIVYTPDATGRLDTITTSGGLIDYDYYPATATSGAGKPSDMRGPYGTDLHFTYDGMLPTSNTWSGDFNASVAWQFNGDFNKTRETVTGPLGSAFVVLGYDRDQKIACASPTTCSPAGSDALRLVRGSHQMVTSIALGSTTETLTYNTFGELARQSANFSGVSQPFVDVTYDATGVERDKLGRVTQRREAIGATTNTYRYTYDHSRRLTGVALNGSSAETFTYDANGNRTSGFSSATGLTSTGTYDDQDRLLSYGPFDYSYNTNGDLETKRNRETGDTWLFQYDTLGNLLSVGLPNGSMIEYVVDAMERRVAKKLNGTVVKQWVYGDALKPAAELDEAGNIVAQFAYGSKSGVPDFVQRGTTTYRVISDQLGSPLYVINAASSADVPFRASYSSFGQVTGTGLDWMPFGFAGGIYDPDTGLVRFGARDYDASVGRWTAKDPVKFAGGVNFYLYAKGDPVNGSDPTGLRYFDLGMSAGIPDTPFAGVGGILIDDCGNLCYYLGGGLGTPGVTGTFGIGTGDPTPGLNGGISFGTSFGYVQGGSAHGSGFIEGGLSTSLFPNVTAAAYYVWCP
jgi:RHS repeat-associated protein